MPTTPQVDTHDSDPGASTPGAAASHALAASGRRASALGPAGHERPAFAGETGGPADTAAERPVIDRAAAVELAARFAADYLSWDEDDPHLRAEVLRAYVEDPRTAAGVVDWPGHGRQRVDLVLPPVAVTTRSTGDVAVRLMVRVATYRREDPPTPDRPRVIATAAPAWAVAVASAPAAWAPGWVADRAYWVGLGVTVRRGRDGRLLARLLHEDEGHDGQGREDERRTGAGG